MGILHGRIDMHYFLYGHNTTCRVCVEGKTDNWLLL